MLVNQKQQFGRRELFWTKIGWWNFPNTEKQVLGDIPQLKTIRPYLIQNVLGTNSKLHL